MELFKLFGTIAINGAEQAQEDIDETTDTAEESGNRIEGAFKRIGTAVATYLAVDKIIDFGKSLVEASASVSAEASAYEQIMGDYADTASEKLGQIADATGMVDTRLTPYMTSMTAKFKGLGFDIEEATTLASDGLTLAADASAFWDKSLDEAMGGLNSFINGSYEGGEAIGLFANDTQLASYAVKQGIVGETKEWANLDEARKQATRLQYAQDMMAMSGATGQASKEADQYANVQANLTEQWRQFKAQIGEPLLQGVVIPAMQTLSDVVTKASDAYQQATQWISEHETELNILGGVLTGVTAGVVAFTIALNWGTIVGAATAALNGVKTAILGVNAAINANPIGLLISLIVGAVAAVIYFWNTSEEFRQFFYDLWDTITEVWTGIWNAISPVVDQIIALWQGFIEWFGQLWDGIVETVTGVWNTISTACQTAWDTITNIIDVAIQFIGQILNLAIEILLIPWNFIWENFGTYLTQAWDFMKNIVSTAINIIQTVITTVLTAISTFMTNAWNAIRTTVSTVWDAISNVISTVWNAISTTISTVLNAIWNVISTVWNTISSTISSIVNGIWNTITTIWNSIKDTISGVVNGISETVSGIFNGIKDTVSGIFNGIKDTATEVWNNIKSAIEDPINTAKETVKNVIDKIKGFFNFEWSLPKLKLPHLSIKGSFSLTPPSVPSFGIEWYAKGGIFDTPTIFQTPDGLKGVGEKGAEAVTPISVLLDYVRTAVSEQTSQTAEQISRLTALLGDYLPEIRDKLDRPIVLNDGTRVSAIAPQMDEKLGDINRGRGRGQ